jgi:hypothetical protein
MSQKRSVLLFAALLVTAVTQFAPSAAAASAPCVAVPVSAPAGAKIESVRAAAQPDYCGTAP